MARQQGVRSDVQLMGSTWTVISMADLWDSSTRFENTFSSTWLPQLDPQSLVPVLTDE